MSRHADVDREHPAVVIITLLLCAACVAIWWTITPP